MPQPDWEGPPKSEFLFTGERFVPHQTDPLLALEHYHRYCFASRFVGSRKVLDLACGEGYGSAFLSRWADTVVGIDSDSATIDHARAKYSSIGNLSFEVGRCEEPCADQEGFDTIVGFEVLEHLDENEQVKFLNNVRRMLKQDGLFIVSSPERDEYAATFETRNQFHKHELTLAGLRTFLETYFKHVHICAQRVLSLSAMWQLRGWQDAQFRLDARKDLFGEIQPGEPLSTPLYLIALCSNIPLADDVIAESNSFYLDGAEADQTKAFLRWAQQLNEVAKSSREVIQHLRQQIKARNEHIDKLQKDFDERTTWALSLEAQVKKDAAHIDKIKKEFDERTEWALSLESELAKERACSRQLTEKLTEITSPFIYRALAKMKLLPR